jgi:hypothetical protein
MLGSENFLDSEVVMDKAERRGKRKEVSGIRSLSESVVSEETNSRASANLHPESSF